MAAPSAQKKILLVLTNHSELGSTGKPTGWYLPEAAHPYYVFKHAGFAVDFVTPNGGKAPVDPGSVENFKDDESKAFISDPEIAKLLDNTLKADAVNPHDYAAIFYAGGHGPLWDIPENAALQKIAREIYEAKGVVGSVCHGPAGIANVKLSNGNYLIAGKKATGFTDAEEDIVQLSAVVPFSLEQVFKQRGAHFENAAPWQSHVTVDERLVTGQNPASAKGAGEAVVKLLQGHKKILLVLTNHSELGNTGKKTGWYLPEAAHPYYVFKHAGYAVDFVTPNGGKAPVDPGSVENFKDDESKAFISDPEIAKLLDNTLKADAVNPHDYAAIFYAGGHGPLWDIPENAALQKIAREIYEAKGVVGSVCHGPAGIANVKLSNGNYLIAGKKATGFTDAEEDIVQLSAVVPFSLEQVFKQRGAHFENAAPWQSHVTVDERLVTGQNPASAKGAGEAVVKLLQ